MLRSVKTHLQHTLETYLNITDDAALVHAMDQENFNTGIVVKTLKYYACIKFLSHISLGSFNLLSEEMQIPYQNK